MDFRQPTYPSPMVVKSGHLLTIGRLPTTFTDIRGLFEAQPRTMLEPCYRLLVSVNFYSRNTMHFCTDKEIKTEHGVLSEKKNIKLQTM
uniref:Uncharacterized protein n=1 Tax=Pyxicephalus adspersus TaxID=30357 RepID=A0AAV3AB24_PYXAD|nr:TPA: hypothetical protein GDO54_008847 [Pyxicephalus adspersus]